MAVLWYTYRGRTPWDDVEHFTGPSWEGQRRALGIPGDRLVQMQCTVTSDESIIWVIWYLVSLYVGNPYSDSWKGEWMYLYSLVRDQPNNGFFSFLPKPAEQDFSDWEVGSVRVSGSHHPDGMWCVLTNRPFHTHKNVWTLTSWQTPTNNYYLIAYCSIYLGMYKQRGLRTMLWPGTWRSPSGRTQQPGPWKNV